MTVAICVMTSQEKELHCGPVQAFADDVAVSCMPQGDKSSATLSGCTTAFAVLWLFILSHLSHGMAACHIMHLAACHVNDREVLLLVLLVMVAVCGVNLAQQGQQLLTELVCEGICVSSRDQGCLLRGL